MRTKGTKNSFRGRGWEIFWTGDPGKGEESLSEVLVASYFSPDGMTKQLTV